MSELVENIKEIIQNIETISEYAHGNDIQQRFHHDLIKMGKCFVVYKKHEEFQFSTSKFTGYKKNNYVSHKKELGKRHGEKTNSRLQKILGDFCTEDSSLYKEIDDAYISYCKRYNIKPAKYSKKRQYWFIKDHNK